MSTALTDNSPIVQGDEALNRLLKEDIQPTEAVGLVWDFFLRGRDAGRKGCSAADSPFEIGSLAWLFWGIGHSEGLNQAADDKARARYGV